MELDDLKQAWQTLDARLQKQNAISLVLFKEGRVAKMRSGLRPLLIGQIVQIVIGIWLVLVGVRFWSAHTEVPHLFASGVVVHVYGVLSLMLGGIVVGHISRITSTAPVLELQRSLAQTRKIYIRSGMLLGLPWCVLWMPFMAVFFMANFGADLFLKVPGLFAWSSVSGMVGLLGILLFLRWSRQPKRARLAAMLDRNAAGSSLQRAQATLDEIKAFIAE